MSKITLKDYIGWSIAVIFGIIAIIQGTRNKQLNDNRQQIHNEAKIVYQYFTTNNYNLPEAIAEHIVSIMTASGPVVTNQTFQNIDIIE